MPRRRRCSSSPSDLMMADDDDEFSNQDDLSPQGSDRCPPQQRNAANARERARMRVLSKAFCRLKTTLPWVPADTKLSKLDTLRLASGYIAHLRALLADQPSEDMQQSGKPLNLSWPFSFQQGGSAPWMSATYNSERISPLHTDNGHNTSIRTHQDHHVGLMGHQEIQQISENNNYCNSNSYHSQYFSRDGYFPQDAGESIRVNNNSNYYNHIYRDNCLKHSYSESLLRSE